MDHLSDPECEQNNHLDYARQMCFLVFHNNILDNYKTTMIQEQQQQTNQWVLTPVQFNLVYIMLEITRICL